MQKDLNLSSIYLLLFCCSCANLFSQTDTLFSLNGDTIPCIIQEISETEVSYKSNDLDKKINKNYLKKICFRNGTIEKFADKKQDFDLSDEKNRDFIQRIASDWGTSVLKCVFTKVNLNTTYIVWDQTYKELNNDSVINISLKTYYSIPGIGDNEQLSWKVKTTTSFKKATFYYISDTDNMTSSTAFLNCFHKLNRAEKDK